jgi:hypothetical protein
VVAACTLTLKKLDGGFAYSAKEKAETLRKAFFPLPPRADLLDINGYEYPPAIKCPEITLREIEMAVRRASPNKALGSNNIINWILH